MEYQPNGKDFIAYAVEKIGNTTIRSLEDLLKYFDEIKRYIPEGSEIILRSNSPIALINRKFDALPEFIISLEEKLNTAPVSLSEYRDLAYEFALKKLRTELEDAMQDVLYYAENVVIKDQNVEWIIGAQSDFDGWRIYNKAMPSSHRVMEDTLVQFPGLYMYVDSIKAEPATPTP